MSKSRGNVADPFALIEKAGVDSVRAYLLGVGGSLKDDSGKSLSGTMSVAQYIFPKRTRSIHLFCFVSYISGSELQTIAMTVSQNITSGSQTR